MLASSTQKTILLVDCNNFYVSCIRAFNPQLTNKAVIVTSNNDGAVVSRSNEAKAIGIKMGVPLFKIRDLIKQHDVRVYSSNYQLFGDMSNRVMSLLAEYSPIQENYSIDESFLVVTGFDDINQRMCNIRDSVLKKIGLPVCVGASNSKTKAKLANYMAKRHPKSHGVFNFNNLNTRQLKSVYSNILIEEVWGIGRKLNASLNDMGIYTVQELHDANVATMRSRFGVVMEKMIRELQGESCIEIEQVANPKKQIICSRSFGASVTEIEDLREAVAHFVTNAALKLRNQQSAASMLQVFIMTNRFKESEPQYCPSICIPLVSPSSDTMTLQNYAMRGLDAIFKTGYQFKKAGVMCSDIVSNDFHQGDLFGTGPENPKLMQVMDAINDRYGRGTLKTSQDERRRAWSMKQDSLCPNYTTDWNHVPRCT